MNDYSRTLRADLAAAPVGMKAVPSLERRRLRAYAAMMLVDALLLNACFALAALAYERIWWEPRAMLAAQTLLPLYLTLALYNGTYSARTLDDWTLGLRKTLTALAVSAALVNFIAFYTKSNAEFSRVAVTSGLATTAIALAMFRRTIPLLIDRFWQGRTRNVLVIEDGGPDFALAGAETISAAALALDPASHDPFMLDRLGKLLGNQDKVVVSCPRSRHHDWALLLKAAGIRGEIVSEPANELGALGVHRYAEQDRTTLVVANGPLGLRGRIAKRLFDIAVASLALLVLAVPMLVVALLVKLEDGGPVLFVQRRTGRGNRFFGMLKFRSMRPSREGRDGAASTARNDMRVTRIGRFIRRTSIDELPQLWNVLRGEMSIVGPRPHAIGSTANDKLFWHIDRQYWQRHCLKPGLTGLAQVRGHRGATEREQDLTDRLSSDLEYVERWSIRSDVAILARTLGVLRHANAY